MRSYVPNTENERRAMLESICAASVEELYSSVPKELLFEGALKLPDGMSELELRRAVAELAAMNGAPMPIFRGAGAYRHYIPAVVPQLAMQSAFYTAYTPYQPEMSQGMLQSIFEFQSLVCDLTGMDAANASVYDGATAAAEAALMLRDKQRKARVLLSAGLNPLVSETVRTYARFAGIETVEIPLADGVTDMEALRAALPNSAGYIAAFPNFYGIVEDMAPIAELLHENKQLLVTYVNPIAMGAYKRAGDMGADVAVGDGQPLGLPLSFGGPYVGFMAAKAALMRNLPGRITGETCDAEGRRAFVLTLQAREQHIRREKASSNICSNQMLCAVMNGIYLSAMGPDGLREVAEQCIQKAHYLAEGLSGIRGVSLRYADKPFFNEFVIDTEKDSEVVSALVKRRGIMGGLPLSRLVAGDRGTLVCCTEMNTREELDAYILATEEAVK